MVDHVLQDVTVIDLSNNSTSFKIGFKYLSFTQRKKMKAVILRNIEDSYKLQTILIANIVRVEDVVLLDGNLTSSIELDIIGEIVRSNPYFSNILDKYIEYLNYDFDITPFRQKNLLELGIYQAKVDFNLEEKELIKQKEILEKHGSLIAFPDQPKNNKKEEDYQILFSSNEGIFNIFLALRRWTDEFGRLDMNLLIQLSKEYGYKVKDIINLMAILYSSYLEHKPKEQTND
jgi:hypothetical protein